MHFTTWSIKPQPIEINKTSPQNYFLFLSVLCAISYSIMFHFLKHWSHRPKHAGHGIRYQEGTSDVRLGTNTWGSNCKAGAGRPQPRGCEGVCQCSPSGCNGQASLALPPLMGCPQATMQEADRRLHFPKLGSESLLGGDWRVTLSSQDPLKWFYYPSVNCEP